MEQVILGMQAQQAQMASFMNQIAEKLAATGLEAPPGVVQETTNPRRTERSFLDAKRIGFMKQFSGTQEEWDMWSFKFLVEVRSMSQEMHTELKTVQNMTGVLDEEEDPDLKTELGQKMSAELHDALVRLCSGDAFAIVASVDGRGFEAWQKLNRKFNPKTMARSIRLICEVVNPQKVVHLRDVEQAMDRWEEKVRRLRIECLEAPLPEGIKIGILTSYLPMAMQDHIYTNVEKGATYDSVAARIRSIVGNKVSMEQGAAPMDVGGLDGHGSRDYGHEDHGHEEEEDVCGVGAHIQCHTCQGWGHYSNKCPSMKKGKGKGKGDANAKGKGKGKGDPKGKGKGKGQTPFYGWCHRCNKQGHRAADCHADVAGFVEEEQDEEVVAEVTNDRCWMVGSVIKVQNRYSTLEEHEDDHCQRAALIQEVQCEKLTGCSAIQFHVSDVKRPLASAVKVCRAGNRVVLDLEDKEGSYIENKTSGERMAVNVDKNETFVFKVQFEETGGEGTITLDSGAGVNVWPRNTLREVPMKPKAKGLKMVAANGSEITNYGQKLIKFRGTHCTPVFNRPT